MISKTSEESPISEIEESQKKYKKYSQKNASQKKYSLIFLNWRSQRPFGSDKQPDLTTIGIVLFYFFWTPPIFLCSPVRLGQAAGSDNHRNCPFLFFLNASHFFALGRAARTSNRIWQKFQALNFYQNFGLLKSHFSEISNFWDFKFLRFQISEISISEITFLRFYYTSQTCESGCC